MTEPDRTIHHLRRREILALAALVAALVGLRLLHLRADVPPGLSDNVGEYVDEGYKTLDARNLVIEGKTHWNPADTYAGWSKKSPATVWINQAAFRLLGVDIASARVFAIAMSSMLLVGVAWLLRGYYPFPILVLVLLFIGLDPVLFFISRLALFEVPMAALLYLVVGGLRRLPPDRPWLPPTLALLAAAVAMPLVKVSAFLYFGPVLAATVAFLAMPSYANRLRFWSYAGALGAVLVVALVLTRHVWMHRLALGPEAIPAVLLQPLAVSSPVLVVGGLAVTLHGLICRPELILRDLYRLSLASIVLLTPVILSLFDYNPLRYYVPILPACALLIADWVHLGGWRFPWPRKVRAYGSAFAIAVLTCCAFYVANAVNQHFLAAVPFGFGEDEGISHAGMMRFVSPLCVAAAAVVWFGRQHLIGPRVLRGATVAGGILFAVMASTSLVRFLVSPVYEGERLHREIAARVAPGEAVAGDWAPFATLGTHARALYVTPKVNQGTSHIDELRPRWYLHSAGMPNSEQLLEALQRHEGVTVGPPVAMGSYAGRDLRLYRLEYADERVGRGQ